MITVSEDKKTIINNLALLGSLITFISNSLDMEIDIEIYKNKIIDDVFFINNTLSKIEEKVANSEISEKEFISILKKIKNLKESAIILMENIIKNKYKQAIIFKAHNKYLKAFINLYKISIAEIQKKLSRKLSPAQENNQVSEEELSFLFEKEDSNNN